MSKLIQIIGAPSSGKSTLATSVHTILKKKNRNSIFVGEAATDFISINGIPTTPLDQIIIFYKQLEKEKMFIDTKDFIICDSSSLLCYIYFRKLFPDTLSFKDITTINHLQGEILKTLNQWHKIYYVPPILNNSVNDGIRYHDKDNILKLDKHIRYYLEIENIKYKDLSDMNIDDRANFIINELI